MFFPFHTIYYLIIVWTLSTQEHESLFVFIVSFSDLATVSNTCMYTCVLHIYSATSLVYVLQFEGLRNLSIHISVASIPLGHYGLGRTVLEYGLGLLSHQYLYTALGFSEKGPYPHFQIIQAFHPLLRGIISRLRLNC